MPNFPKWLVGIFAALFAILLLLAILLLAAWLLTQLGSATWVSLPVLAILGMLLLLIILAAVSVTFGHFGLSDKSQALALPQGSIRAVIALSLVVIFAILTVFLYGTLASGTQLQRNTVVPSFDRAEFLRTNPSVKDVVLISQDPTTKASTIALIVPVDPAGVDFGKQLLTLIGTLMTAATAFYFGAQTAAAAAAQASDGAKPPLTLRSITPASHKGADGPFSMNIGGDNLNNVTSVKIVHNGVQIDATDVHSNPNSVVCTVPVGASTPAGAWDVVVVDGDTRSGRLPGALNIA
jgi:hypothetical protein